MVRFLQRAWLLPMLITQLYAQSQLESLKRAGKAEFKKPFGEQDYSVAVRCFEQAVQLAPQDAECWYFLSYALDRIQNKDASVMNARSAVMTQRASQAMETCISLEPEYKGEWVALDPYSKITSLWGALALQYWAMDKSDSLQWALEEGRRRGGFGGFMLSVNRRVLDVCPTNTILMSSGDNSTYPLLYLQFAEKYRTDVRVVDVNLLNAPWYPRVLVTKGVVDFGYPLDVLDTLEYSVWEPRVMQVPIRDTDREFSWTLKPSYYDHYLMRADLLFYGLIFYNRFEQDILFAPGFPESSKLSLKNHIREWDIADRLVPDDRLDDPDRTDEATRTLEEVSHVNRNCAMDVRMVQFVRTRYLETAANLLNTGDRESAKSLLKLTRKYVPESQFPWESEAVNTFQKQLSDKLK